jgi:glycosyltransferase, group 1 family
MKKKRILFFIPTLMNGGAERVLTNLVNNLDESKYDISVKTIMNEGRYRSQLKSHIHYTYVFGRLIYGTSLFFTLFSPRFLFKWLIGNKYDIVVSYLEGPTSRIVSGCTSSKTKIVSWIHIELNDYKQFSNGFRSYKEAVECYNKMDCIVCVSNTVKEAFCKHPIQHEKVVVKYNTNETEVIKWMAKEQVQDVDFNSKYFNICSVAKIVKTKGYDRLARIHKRLLNEGYNIHTYILGEGDQREVIERYLQENECLESFVFLGYRENPYKYVSKCDLYVCSSLREGFSTAVTEALVMGIPAISTNCSGAYELLGYNNEYGIVTSNDEESLYKGIKLLLDSPLLLANYREKSLFRGNKFEKKITVSEIEALFEKL